MTRVLAILTVLVGIILAVTPWVLRFAADRVALADVLIGGIVVAVLGLLSYQTLASASTHRAQH